MVVYVMLPDLTRPHPALKELIETQSAVVILPELSIAAIAGAPPVTVADPMVVAAYQKEVPIVALIRAVQVTSVPLVAAACRKEQLNAATDIARPASGADQAINA